MVEPLSAPARSREGLPCGAEVLKRFRVNMLGGNVCDEEKACTTIGTAVIRVNGPGKSSSNLYVKESRYMGVQNKNSTG